MIRAVIRRHPMLRVVLAGAALSLGVVSSSLAAPRTYGIDEDPIRLGERALAEGRLTDARHHFEEALENGYKEPRARFGLARVTVLEGDFEDAEPLYREALAGKPGSPEEEARIRARLGLLLVRLGRELEAEQEFDVALAADPDQWEAWYGRAHLMLDRGQIEEAERILKGGADRKGTAEGQEIYLYGMARVHLARAELREAEIAALQALELNPQDPAIAALVGRIYEARGTPTLAIDAFEKSLATPGVVRTAPMLHNLGQLYAEVRRFDDARDKYVEAVAIDSTYAPALGDLGHLYYAAGRHEQAARVYLRYAVLVPDDLDALLELSESCLEVHQFAQALEAATAAMRIDDTRDDIRFAFARAGIRSTDDEAKARAAASYAELEGKPGWVAADHSLLASYQMATGDLESARTHFDEAIRLDPGDPHANYLAGILAMKRGETAKANEHLEAAVRGAPDIPAYQLNLGIARLRAGDTSAAIEAIQSALDLNPDLTVGRVILAQAYAAAGDLTAAEAEYDRVLRAEPHHAQALRGKGFCRLRDADYEGAADAYALATEAEAENADAWAGLGLARLGRGDWPAAEEAFGRAEKLDPNNRSLQRGRELLVQAREGAVIE